MLGLRRTHVNLLECTPDDPQGQLFRLLCALDAPLRMLVQERDTLESAFLKATAEESVDDAE